MPAIDPIKVNAADLERDTSGPTAAESAFSDAQRQSVPVSTRSGSSDGGVPTAQPTGRIAHLDDLTRRSSASSSEASSSGLEADPGTTSSGEEAAGPSTSSQPPVTTSQVGAKRRPMALDLRRDHSPVDTPLAQTPTSNHGTPGSGATVYPGQTALDLTGYFAGPPTNPGTTFVPPWKMPVRKGSAPSSSGPSSAGPGPRRSQTADAKVPQTPPPRSAGPTEIARAVTARPGAVFGRLRGAQYVQANPRDVVTAAHAKAAQVESVEAKAAEVQPAEAKSAEVPAQTPPNTGRPTQRQRPAVTPSGPRTMAPPPVPPKGD
jgi:hypothetical protein